MGATLWVLLVVVGTGMLVSVGRVKKPFLKAIAVRGAACSFAGAGVVGASGWIGHAIASAMSSATSALNMAGAGAFGANISWIVAGVLGAMWLSAMIPESWFSWDMPDWLSMAGLVLPSLVGTVPGPVGEFMSGAMTGAGHLMVGLVRSAVQGG